MRTWLVVAADQREFDGILRRIKVVSGLDWPGVKFAREAVWKDCRWRFVANGPGPHLAAAAMAPQAREGTSNVNGIVSTGFCGALDPSLAVGDIVVWGEKPLSAGQPYTQGGLVSADRVAVTSAEKKRLREETGAIAVEMEAAAVAAAAREWNVPFRCVRVVSDTASEDMPLDFNLYRSKDGRFSRGRIALAALARPRRVLPALRHLGGNCRVASEKLGEFFDDCTF